MLTAASGPNLPTCWGLEAGVAELSESSDIIPKSSVSLREAWLVSLKVTSNGFGDSGGGGGGGGGSTGLGRNASEESTQSPTEDEMVALTLMSPLACWCRRRVFMSPGSGMKPPHASSIAGSVEIMAPSWDRLGTGRSCSSLHTRPAVRVCSAVSNFVPY